MTGSGRSAAAPRRRVRAGLEPPHIVEAEALSIAGLAADYRTADWQAIAMQWRSLLSRPATIPGQVGLTGYGVCCGSDGAGNFRYLTGVEVAGVSGLPDALSHVSIPARRYLVFRHRATPAALGDTLHAIWHRWLPGAVHRVADSPDFQRYGQRGGIEIWIPIEA